MIDIEKIGSDWVAETVAGMTHELVHISPTAFNEEKRYLPGSVTPMPGFIRYDTFPYLREILDNFDSNSSVREVNLQKGAQVGWSTLLESILFYYMGHIKSLPVMYMTADAGLADARVENNFIPMLQQSEVAHWVQSSDEGNSRKTGKTKDHIQFAGGGYMVPFGANNATKMRTFSIALMLKDEIDGWPYLVGKDGNPDKLSDSRLKAYWDRRKIARGSTPLIKGASRINENYLLGDQRKYNVKCKKCGVLQYLRWSFSDGVGGMKWDLEEDGTLIKESVRYCCKDCGHAHFETDKERLFSAAHGATWVPTAKPKDRDVRSYHLSGLYSPWGFFPWYQCVLDYLEAYDPVDRKVKDVGKFQVFYNNVLGEPFEMMGSKIQFTSVSAHRRTWYTKGHIPNLKAQQVAGSPILMITCQVDVHKTFLAVAVMGWARDARTFVVEYLRIEGDDFSDPSCSGWGELREIIEEKRWVADDGKTYGINITFIDSGYAADTVVNFCADYGMGVYPIKGVARPARAAAIKEFSKFETQAKTTGFLIVVDHYKDRIAPVLRREWDETDGEQKQYHFNAPMDTTEAEIKELTAEVRREKIDAKGQMVYEWYRPGDKRNELWDLLCYGHAAVEVYAWNICIQHFKLEVIDWPAFWDFLQYERVLYVDTPVSNG